MIRKYALFKVFDALRQSEGTESIRGLSRKANVGPATAKQCCDYLFSKDLISKRVMGKMYLYQLNLENPLTRQLKISASIAELIGVGLIKELRSSHPSLLCIILFGSVALGRDTPKSDIDILLVSRTKISLKPLVSEKHLSRELAILSYSFVEWREKAKKEKPFYEQVILDGISIFGELPVIN